MRLRNNPEAANYLAASSFVISYEDLKDLKKLFNNDNPIYMEIGMGKGNFLAAKAEMYPEINFIGIEKYDTVLTIATKKIEEKNLSNVKLTNLDADKLLEYVAPKSLDKIFLNFSDPWPKARHAKRRLTYKTFLEKYFVALKDEAYIEFRTDNDGLFEFTLEHCEENNYPLRFQTTNFHASEKFVDGIMTEYERKFSSLGKNINYVEIARKDS